MRIVKLISAAATTAAAAPTGASIGWAPAVAVVWWASAMPVRRCAGKSAYAVTVCPVIASFVIVIPVWKGDEQPDYEKEYYKSFSRCLYE